MKILDGFHKPWKPHRPEAPRRKCGTVEMHQAWMERSPEYRQKRREIEQFTAEYLQRRDELGAGLRTGIITIPVVVHVVYNTALCN